MFDLQCIEILLSFKERKKHHHWTKALRLINNNKKFQLMCVYFQPHNVLNTIR